MKTFCQPFLVKPSMGLGAVSSSRRREKRHQICNSKLLRLLSILGILIVLAGFVADTARADTIIGTTYGHVQLEVPDPNDPTKCITVIFGELAGRLGVDRSQQWMVIGFRKTYTGPTCCDSLHFLNIVTSDPNPPKWKDDSGIIRPIDPNEIYIDPLSGGNIPPVPAGQTNPNPPADRLPWYDGETTSQKASTTGDFDIGEKTEYDLNDIKDPPFDWVSDPVLDIVFADAPNLTDGLKFVTVVMCVWDKYMCPAGGIAWGRKSGGMNYIDPMFSGNNYPSYLDKGKIQAGLNRSGFNGYTSLDKCCPCIPEPTTLSLLGIGLLLTPLILRRKGRRMGRR